MRVLGRRKQLLHRAGLGGAADQPEETRLGLLERVAQLARAGQGALGHLKALVGPIGVHQQTQLLKVQPHAQRRWSPGAFVGPPGQ